MLAQELTFHHRNPPQPPVADALGHLPAITEEAQRLAQRQPRLTLKAGVTGGGGAGEDALAHPCHQLLAQGGARGGKEQERHPRAPIGGFLGCQHPFDPRLDPAADHRGGKAGGGAPGDLRPAGVRRGHDDAGSAHGEGLGEAFADGNAVDLHVQPPTQPLAL